MFDLENHIAAWRQEMFLAGIKSPEVLDELESHLRGDVAQQIHSGASEQAVFAIASQQIGQAKLINLEFKKIETTNWNRPLAWVAWGLFALSLFLPVFRTGPGWMCVVVLSAAWWSPDGIRSGEWPDIHAALVTLANLFMLASPFLLSKFSRNARSLKWLRCSNVAAFALVWSYFVLLLFADKMRSDLKIGCYVWALSFLLLFLSQFRRREKRNNSYVEAS